MKEITLEIKQKIFALYWGQSVLKDIDWPIKHEPGAKIDEQYIKYISSHQFLHLTPLSQITDEDAIEVYNLALYDRPHIDFYKLKKKNFIDQGGKYAQRCQETSSGYFTGPGIALPVIDLLRSRGYALPAFGFSVDDLVQAGVFKLNPNPAKAQ